MVLGLHQLGWRPPLPPYSPAESALVCDVASALFSHLCKNLIPFPIGVFTKKERRQARLNSKKHSDVVPGLLADWEILRRDDTEKEKKHELVDKMLGMLKVSPGVFENPHAPLSVAVE